MRKLITIFLILCLTTSATGQFQQKPMLGEQINWAHPLSKGLVLYELFNEGSGNKVFDLSGNRNSGLFQGTGGVPIWVSGKFGPAISFSGGVPGTKDYIRVENSDTVDLTESMTIVVGFKTSTSSSPLLCKQKADYEEGYQLSTSAGGNINFYVEQADDTKILITGGSTVVDGKHHQVGAVRDYQKFLYLYIDGISDATPVVDNLTTSISNTNYLFFGVLADNGNFYTGLIDYIMIYNRALSPSEIALLYRGPFCMFVQDDIALMEAAIPAPSGGQVIIIQMSAIPLILISALIFIRRRKRG